VLGGLSDFLLPSTITNGHGAITGLANIAPVSHQTDKITFWLSYFFYSFGQYSVVGLYALAKATRKDMALLPSALKLQVIIAHADFRIANASIAGTKFLLEKLYGYGGVPRRPLLPLDSDVSQALWDHPDTQYLIEMERESNLI
jgi:4-hydroxy-2-oxoglutarate aldolase